MKHYLILCVAMSGLIGGCGKSEEPAPTASAAAATPSKNIQAAQGESYKETMHRLHPDDPKFK